MDYRVQNLDTPHRPNTKFQKNVQKKSGKIIFPKLWFLIKKLDHNSDLHAKSQREISKNKVTLCMDM